MVALSVSGGQLVLVNGQLAIDDCCCDPPPCDPCQGWYTNPLDPGDQTSGPIITAVVTHNLTFSCDTSPGCLCLADICSALNGSKTLTKVTGECWYLNCETFAIPGACDETNLYGYDASRGSVTHLSLVIIGEFYYFMPIGGWLGPILSFRWRYYLVLRYSGDDDPCDINKNTLRSIAESMSPIEGFSVRSDLEFGDPTSWPCPGGKESVENWAMAGDESGVLIVDDQGNPTGRANNSLHLGGCLITYPAIMEWTARFFAAAP